MRPPKVLGDERNYCVTVYLLALSRLCAEVARDQRLVPEFVGVIKLVPLTLAEMKGANRSGSVDLIARAA